MTTIDLVFLAAAALFTLLGAYWGLIRQLLSVVGLIVGTAAAGRYGTDVGVWLSSFISVAEVSNLLGYIAVLLLVSAAASLAASLLRLFAGLLFLGWLDHLFGAVLGFLQAVLAAGALLLGLAAFPIEPLAGAVQASQLAPIVLVLSLPLTAVLPELFSTAVLYWQSLR